MRKLRSPARVLLLVLLLTGCSAAPASPPQADQLTGAGHLRLELEELLRAKVPGYACEKDARHPDRPIRLGLCGDFAQYSTFVYEFTERGPSSFSVSATAYRKGDYFGNNTVPVLLDAHLITCDVPRHWYLYEYIDSANFSLGCGPGHIIG